MLKNEMQIEIHKIFSENLLQWIPIETLKICIIKSQNAFINIIEQKKLRTHCKTNLQSLEIPGLIKSYPSYNMPIDAAALFFNQSVGKILTTLNETNSQKDVYSNFYAYLLALSKRINLSFDDAFSLEMKPYLEKFTLEHTENPLTQ